MSWASFQFSVQLMTSNVLTHRLIASFAQFKKIARVRSAISRAARAAAHVFIDLQRDPNPAAIVATAFMVFAPVVVTVGIPMAVEVPIVGVKIEANSRCVVVAVRMPAITIVITCDIGGSRD